MGRDARRRGVPHVCRIALAVGALAILVPPWLSGCGGDCNCCCGGTNEVEEQSRLCVDHLKKTTLALLMYAQDYDETLPTRSVPWADALSPYAKSEYLYRCPTVYAQDRTAYGYALNAALPDTHLGQWGNPDFVPAFYDSTTLTRSAVDHVTSLPAPGRHLGVNNIAYLDGHVEGVAP